MRAECIAGPMFCGKSTELCRRMHRLESIGKNVLYVKPAKDTRGGSSHISPRSTLSKVSCVSVESLCEILPILFGPIKYDAIAVDEAQFFDDSVTFLNKLELMQAIQDDIIVVFACLLGDSDRFPWATVTHLLPRMDDIQFLKACCVYCANGIEAAFTKCLVRKDAVELIGDSESYVAVCRKHYLISKQNT